MIRLRTDFFSESLVMGTSMVVLMPQATTGQIGMGGAVGDGPPPVLYLLHGLSDDCTIWERRTSIERYASEAGIAVVMPEVRRSFYTDEAVGDAYWTYIAEELPRIVARTFRVSEDPADTFVAGLSMGGFGALKLALNHPDRFGAAASLSGVVDLSATDLFTRSREGHLGRRVWDGRDIAGTVDDIPGLLERAEPGALPPLYLSCGTEDSLFSQNERVAALADERGHDLTVDFRPGDHTWEFWDAGIQDVLAWLPLGGR
ncbi:alpha/beta hydrolase [Brachybacterium huguangmaarense]